MMNTSGVRFGHVFEVRGPQPARQAFDLFSTLVLQEKDTRQHVKQGIHWVGNLPGMKFIHNPHGAPERAFIVTDGDIPSVVAQQREIFDARSQGKRQLANRLVKRLTRLLRIATRKSPEIESIIKK